MTSTDEQFDAMASSQRRQLLVQLLVDGPQSVPSLSSASSDLLHAHPKVLQKYLSGSEEVASANKADIRTYHVHLPMLAEYEYIEWNRDAHFVTRGANFDDVRPLLELLDDQRNGRAARDAPLSVRK
jgi:phage terminase large subunit GpA-like protein